ncbi:MAG: S-layer homology domain-containing protein [bacterium]|nr:S-layer homology domain-containing protein [bacterium]MDE0601520.1 S-layer homology domain-containing protein [bacterium]
MSTRHLFIVLAFVLGLTGGVVLARSTTGFTDVPAGHYAEDAIAWAVEQGITQGCADDRFCPDEKVTRAEIVTFLYRYHLQEQTSPTTTSTTYTLRPGQYAPTTGETAQTSLAKMEHIDIAPANCDGWISGGAYFEKLPPTMFWRRGDTVGYLSYGTHTTVDFVVSPYEAWCSGVRNRMFTLDAYNTRPVVGSVDESKAYFDPLEWWNRDDPASPQNTNYPGWCEYLHMHVDVKYRYQATMDQAEYDFVKEQLGNC